MRTTIGQLSRLFLTCGLIYGALLLVASRGEGDAPATDTKADHTALLARLPLDFVENRGQWDPPTRFAAQKGAMVASFERDAIRLRLEAPRPAALSLTFEHASQKATLIGQDPRGGYYNFFLGNDPAKWYSRVAAYAGLLYRGLYNGVDVHVRETAEQLEYDLMLAPGAELDQVVIRADGASR
jgi:hypothetical protein